MSDPKTKRRVRRMRLSWKKVAKGIQKKRGKRIPTMVNQMAREIGEQKKM